MARFPLEDDVRVEEEHQGLKDKVHEAEGEVHALRSIEYNVDSGVECSACCLEGSMAMVKPDIVGVQASRHLTSSQNKSPSIPPQIQGFKYPSNSIAMPDFALTQHIVVPLNVPIGYSVSNGDLKDTDKMSDDGTPQGMPNLYDHTRALNVNAHLATSHKDDPLYNVELKGLLTVELGSNILDERRGISDWSSFDEATMRTKKGKGRVLMKTRKVLKGME
ncbi:hypothetical protein IW261DRAFT_1412903 [Armillaria novae-zelandiae]|uniref:Uncharacterized protein n=1 Tax=Armillaria novae-zelandiae TaxID=153914 RepID=A0AA39PV67_9AGAR|nr:hypothetical protein IW261DRAFT_1412903 [Armillaria novae-zelandiae]